MIIRRTFDRDIFPKTAISPVDAMMATMFVKLLPAIKNGVQSKLQIDLGR